MTLRRGSRRRRLGDLTARDIDEGRRSHDEAELARHDREQEAREPVEDVDPAEAARTARWLREWRAGRDG